MLVCQILSYNREGFMCSCWQIVSFSSCSLIFCGWTPTNTSFTTTAVHHRHALQSQLSSPRDASLPSPFHLPFSMQPFSNITKYYTKHLQLCVCLCVCTKEWKGGRVRIAVHGGCGKRRVWACVWGSTGYVLLGGLPLNFLAFVGLSCILCECRATLTESQQSSWRFVCVY